FSVPVDQIFGAATDMSAEWRQEYESLARNILSHVAKESQPDPDQVRNDFQLKAFMVLDDAGHIIRSSAEPGLATTGLIKAIRSAVADQSEAFLETSNYWIAIRSTKEDDQHEILAAVFEKPGQIAESTGRIAANLQDYHSLAQSRRAI